MRAVSPADQDLSFALELADLADAITMERFLAEDLKVETKPDMTPVSEADREVEEQLRSQLSRYRPEDAVLGEEYGDTGVPAGGRRWIIDPIDGTKNFVRGIPVWATLLACEEDGVITAGVVSAPAMHRRWWASRGAGAYVQEGFAAHPRRLSVSGIATLEDAQLSQSSVQNWEAIGRLDEILELERRCWRARGFGDFWSYMLVAEGAVEIGLDAEAALWDLAAMQVIVEEAGGRFTDLAGVARPDGGNAIATNTLVHAAALAIVGSVE
jgi:histidinol-phosphatase